MRTVVRLLSAAVIIVFLPISLGADHRTAPFPPLRYAARMEDEGDKGLTSVSGFFQHHFLRNVRGDEKTRKGEGWLSTAAETEEKEQTR